MAFQQGLSGLNAASQALDVSGNNIANASTVGFKSSTPHFSDVYAASLGGGGSASQVGIGVTVSAVQQQFTQGNITSTNNPLDLAINGDGFFRLSTNNVISFTRNGQFQLNNAGYVVNDKGQRLTGYPVNSSGAVIASSPVDLQLSSAELAPRATSAALSGNMTAVINLDSRSSNPAVTPFNASNPQTYNFSTGLSVYDTLGVAHTLTTYYVRTGAGAWDVNYALDGTVSATVSNLTFNSSGQLTSGPTYTVPSFTLTTGATTPWSPGTLDFTGSTQYGTASGVSALTQGGYTAGSLSGVSIDDDGVILGSYSNGQSRNLGQVALAKFTAPTGLVNLGSNQWAESSASGQPLINAPGTSGLGVISASAIEESNVDLTAQLVALITDQRNYQASAQTIKTQDQVLQTLVNLR